MSGDVQDPGREAEDRRLADAARQAGLATRGTDREVAEAVRAMWAAFQKVAASMRSVINDLWPVWAEFARNLAPLVEAYERGELQLLDPGDRSCHCLCPMHRAAGMFCTAERAKVVTLIGGIESPGHVPMCQPCADWWVTARPDRVAHVGKVTLSGTA